MSSARKLEKLNALFNSTGSQGERAAVLAAIARVEASEHTQAVREWTVRFPDYGSSRLFEAVCEKYGVEVYQYKGQKRTTLNYKTTEAIKDPLVKEYNALFTEWVELNDQILDELLIRYTAASQPVSALIEASNKGASE